MPENQTSTICYLEIPAPDIEKTGEFFSSVFGWKVSPSNLTDKVYWEFSTGEGEVSGGFVPERKVARDAGVLLYLKVADINQTLEEIKLAGGSVCSEKREIGGGFGYSATFEDPNGNPFGLFSIN